MRSVRLSAESLSADFWPAIFVLGAVVYISRILGLVVIPADAITPALERRLRLVPVAILTALIAPNLATPNGVQDTSILMAAATTAFISAITKQPVMALLVGMLALACVRGMV